MTDLAGLEDLPASYPARLKALNLVPLWPSLRAVLPPDKPRPNTRATAWAYQDIKPLLLQAGELTPIEKAERRAMSRRDLILTPTGLWHEHGHDGDAPVIWLDVLDLPLVHYLEASYHRNGRRQATLPGRSDRAYLAGGLVPTPVFGRSGKAYPMLRYPWAQARAALLALADDRPDLEAVQLPHTNPETGADAENILGFYALLLRPGQTLALPARSPASVFHIIEGGAELVVSDQRFSLARWCPSAVIKSTRESTPMSHPTYLWTPPPVYALPVRGQAARLPIHRTSGATGAYPPETSNGHFEMALVVAIGSAGFRMPQADAHTLIDGCACGLDMTRCGHVAGVGEVSLHLGPAE